MTASAPKDTLLQWLLTQRIRRAQELLEPPITALTPSPRPPAWAPQQPLRRHFRRTVGVPPDSYRQTFRS